MLTFHPAVHRHASLADFNDHLESLLLAHTNPTTQLKLMASLAASLQDETRDLLPKLSAVLDRILLTPAPDDTKTTTISNLCAHHAFLRNQKTCHAILADLFQGGHERYVDSSRPHAYHQPTVTATPAEGLDLQSTCLYNDWQDTLELIWSHQDRSAITRKKIRQFRSYKTVDAAWEIWLQDGLAPVLCDAPRYLRLGSGHFLTLPTITGDTNHDAALAWLKSRLDIDPNNERLYFSLNNLTFLLNHTQYLTALSPANTTQRETNDFISMLRAPRPLVTWADELLENSSDQKIEHTLIALQKASFSKAPATAQQPAQPFPSSEIWDQCWEKVKTHLLINSGIYTIWMHGEDEISFYWQGGKDDRKYSQFLHFEKILTHRPKPGEYCELHRRTDTPHTGIAKNECALSRIFVTRTP